VKEIVIFGSYCNTKEKLERLEKSITDAKALGLDVLVFGRYPIPPKTQQMCDYWIFDKSNPVLKDRALEHWLMHSGKRMSNWFYDYGYAALEQITKSLGFVKSLNYDVAYWLVYDVDLTNFPEYREICKAKLENYNVVCSPFYPVSYGEAKGISGTSVAFKVGESYDRLKGVITETFYRDLISRRDQFISEDFMEECFKVSELKYYLTNDLPVLPAVLTSTGVRKHGDVPLEFNKTREYFLNFFVGWDENRNHQVAYIYNIVKPFSSISISTDNNFTIIVDPIEVNQHGGVEIDLYDAKKIIIEEINGESIDETLDLELTELYWELNKIKNIQ
jgi:hypothetical protein